MKYLTISFFFLLAIFSFYLGYQQDEHSASVEAEIDAIYQLMIANSRTQYVIMDTEGRILHYVAKHDHEVTGCPECGLIKQLGIRKNEIYEQLSGDLPIVEREALMIEESNIDKYMLRSKP